MTTVLVVEDSESVQEQIAQILKKSNYQVVIAQDGFEAIQFAREARPDIVVCDIGLPELDGYEVLNILRNDSTTASIPFIFLTGKAEKVAVRLGMELGADDYLTKPFEETQLLAAIKTQLQKRASLEALQLRTLTQKYVRSRDEERRVLARKLHTDITQPLAGLKLSLHGIDQLPLEEAAQRIEGIEDLADQILSQAIAATHNIWPLFLDNLGLLPALLQLFEQTYAQADLKVEFIHNDLNAPFSHDLIVTVYRIAEEALQNTARYAQVSTATVKVWADEDVLRVDISDQGVGFDLEATFQSAAGGGLFELKERVSALGGELTILSEPRAGVRVMAELPLGSGTGIGDRPGEVTRVAASQYVETSTPLSRSRAGAKSETSARTVTDNLIGIMFAEENHIIREGLRRLFESAPEFVLLGEATHREQIFSLVLNRQPKVLILAVTMSGTSTLDLVQPLRNSLSSLRVLAFSGYADETYAYEAFRYGVSGYILNNVKANELLAAVRTVANDQNFWGTALSEVALKQHMNDYYTNNANSEIYGTLTEREREILRLIASGKTSKQIAAQLSISWRTADTHRANIARKLGLHTQADIIRYAFKHGLINLDQ